MEMFEVTFLLQRENDDIHGDAETEGLRPELRYLNARFRD